MEKETTDDDFPDVFTFHVALAQSSTYYRWRQIGVQQQLTTDEEIACFLMDCYEKGETLSSSGSGACVTCRALLRLSCVNCGAVNTQSCHVNTVHRAAASAGSKDDLDNEGEMLQGFENSGISDGRNPIQSEPVIQTVDRGGAHPHQLYTEEAAQQLQTLGDLSEQIFRAESLMKQETDVLIVQTCVGTQESEGQGPESNSGDPASLHQEEETKGQTDEETVAPPRTPSGRGRPRKYPKVSLVCGVCDRKLSSRQSLFCHMTSKHPETELPPSLAHLAMKQTSRPKSTSKRGRKKKLAESRRRRRGKAASAQANTLLDSDVEESVLNPGIEANEEVTHLLNSLMKEKKRRRKAELMSLKCETCGVTFEHRRQMYTHRRLCTWKVCHLCGKSVKLLDMHLKRHSAPRRFPCPQCPKSFLFRNYLVQHMLYHNNERPFCCEICGMRYRERARLNAHLRTHTGTKPFKCTQCDAAFTRNRGLKDHQRVHTGEKPYACQVCGRQFSSSGNLAAHRRKVHRLEPQVPNRMTRKLYVEPAVNEPVMTGGGPYHEMN